MTVPVPRKRGRPPRAPALKQSCNVAVRLTQAEYDSLCALAREKRMSLAGLLRMAAVQVLLDTRGARLLLP